MPREARVLRATALGFGLLLSVAMPRAAVACLCSEPDPVVLLHAPDESVPANGRFWLRIPSAEPVPGPVGRTGAARWGLVGRPTDELRFEIRARGGRIVPSRAEVVTHGGVRTVVVVPRKRLRPGRYEIVIGLARSRRVPQPDDWVGLLLRGKRVRVERGALAGRADPRYVLGPLTVSAEVDAVPPAWSGLIPLESRDEGSIAEYRTHGACRSGRHLVIGVARPTDPHIPRDRHGHLFAVRTDRAGPIDLSRPPELYVGGWGGLTLAEPGGCDVPNFHFPRGQKSLRVSLQAVDTAGNPSPPAEVSVELRE